MNKEKIVEISNQCLDIFRNSDLKIKELIVVLSQLLIYTGKSITDKEIDLDNLDINELYKIYYADNKSNDIGLGLLLNGLSMMSTIKVPESKELQGENNG